MTNRQRRWLMQDFGWRSGRLGGRAWGLFVALLFLPLAALSAEATGPGNPVLNGDFEIVVPVQDAVCLVAGDTQVVPPPPLHTVVYPCETSAFKAVHWVSAPAAQFADWEGDDGDREMRVEANATADPLNAYQSYASPFQAWSARVDAATFRIENGTWPANATVHLGFSLSPGWLTSAFVGSYWDGSVVFDAADVVPGKDGIVVLDPVTQGSILCPSWQPCRDMKKAFEQADDHERARILSQLRLMQFAFWGLHLGAEPVVLDDVALAGAQPFAMDVATEGQAAQADALLSAAARLEESQRPFGNWAPPGTTEGAGELGTAAMALLDGYRLSANGDLLDGASRAAGVLRSRGFHANHPADVVFMSEFATVSKDKDARIHAVNAARWWTTFTDPDAPGRTGAAAVTALLERRHAGEPGPIAQDLALYVEAAKLGGYEDFAGDLGKEILFLLMRSSLDETPAAHEEGVAGLASAIRGLALADMSLYRAILEEQADVLTSLQERSGAFPAIEGGKKLPSDTRATALALKAFAAIGRTQAADDAARFLVGHQRDSGDWDVCHRREDGCAAARPATTSLAAQALSEVVVPTPEGYAFEVVAAVNGVNQDVHGGHFLPNPLPLAP